MRPSPTLELEQETLHRLGVAHIAGVDEAGRGALAGPVYAAAVVLSLDDPRLVTTLSGVNDSKKLSARQREALFPVICSKAVAYGVGWVSAAEIDQMGIVPATQLAMTLAIDQLNPAAEFVLVDGRASLPTVTLPQRSVVRGDSLSLSIAAASILAKVSRDMYMRSLELRYPEYEFGRHKGYGTARHLAAIIAHGPCPEHRLSFAPFHSESSLLADKNS